MKRCLALLFLTLSVICQATGTTITTTQPIRDPRGGRLNGKIVFYLPAPAVDTTNHSPITPVAPPVIVNNGLLAGTVTLVGNDSMSPKMYYSANLYDLSGRWLSTYRYYVTGTTFDLGSAPMTPVTTSNISQQDWAVGSLSVSGLVSAYTSAGELIGKFSSISAAYAALPSGNGKIEPSCGIYSENIIFTTAVTLSGVDKTCVIIRPAVAANPTIQIDSSVHGGIDGVIVENVTLQCSTLPWTQACGDMIQITGSQSTNEINDHLTIRDVIIGNMYQLNTAGTLNFLNGINFIGRSIYSNIERVMEFGGRNVGLVINPGQGAGTTGPINDLHVVNSSFFGNFNQGITMNCAGSVSSCASNHFDSVESTENGLNTVLSPCSAISINTVWQAKFTNFYAEADCLNSADVNAALIRVTGSALTPNQVDISTATFVMTATGAKYGVYVDAVRASGTWDGLRYIGTPTTASVHVATTDVTSHIEILNATTMTKPDIVADAFGNTHVSIPAVGVFAKTVINNANCPLSTNKFDLFTGCTGVEWPINSIGVTAGPATINNFTSGIPNQTLQVCSDSGVITLAHAAGGNGQLSFAGAVNKILQSNECVLLRRILAADQWNEIAISAPKVLANTGSAAAPSIAFANDAGTGFTNGIGGAGTISLAVSGVHQIEYAASLQRNRAGGLVGWSSNTDPSVAQSDTTLCRSAAGVVGVNTSEACGTAGEIRSARISATYNAAGTLTTAVHFVQDTCTLGTNCGVTLTGSAAFTNSTSYTCNCQDETAIGACKVAQTSGSAFTVTGTGTDLIRYSCIGN